MSDKRKKIIELATILKTDQYAISFFEDILRMMSGELPSELFINVTDFIHGKVIPLVVEDIYNLYEDALDEKQLDLILGFYNSEPGKYFLEFCQKIQEQVLKLNGKWESYVEKGMKELGILSR